MAILHVCKALQVVNIKSALVILSVFFLCIKDSQAAYCTRDRTRVARLLINQNFIYQFDYYGYTIPTTCPLHPSRDMYLDNEKHREIDNNNRWSCNYCGKTFINEQWLDEHFDNRHRIKVYRGEGAVCLNDHCDYLRCEVLSGAKKPSYWEQALCKQSELDELKCKCESTLKSCLPEDLTGMKRHDFLEKLKKSMCNSLTCEKYWENPMKETAPHTAAVYIIVSCVLAVGLLLYYLIAYTHFYSNESLLTDSDGLIKHRQTEDEQYNHLQAPEGTAMRNRPGYATSGT